MVKDSETLEGDNVARAYLCHTLSMCKFKGSCFCNNGLLKTSDIMMFVFHEKSCLEAECTARTHRIPWQCKIPSNCVNAHLMISCKLIQSRPTFFFIEINFVLICLWLHSTPRLPKRCCLNTHSNMFDTDDDDDGMEAVVSVEDDLFEGHLKQSIRSNNDVTPNKSQRDARLNGRSSTKRRLDTTEKVSLPIILLLQFNVTNCMS